MRAQSVRLADVFFVGPVMIAGGLKLGKKLGTMLALLGVATIVYNGANYMEAHRRGEA